MAERRLTLQLLRDRFAHDFQNLLLPAATLIALLEKRRDFDTSTAELLRVASENLQTARDSLARVTRMHAGEAPQMDAVGVGTIVEAAIEPLRSTAGAKQVAIECDTGNSRVMADATALAHAFREIVTNAIAAAPRGSTVTISAAREGNHVQIAIIDRGSGVSVDVEAALFCPFAARRTSDATPRGLGLGLVHCQAILAAHGGSIAYARTNGETCFSVRLRAA
jgi:two-component system sensor histidine kinase SenX3